MGNPNNFVLDHIVEAILIKLPVRSLFRFKAVSNSFLSLISSPIFVFAHYQPSKTIPSSSMIFQSGRKIFEYSSRRTPPPVFHVVDLITKKRQVLDLPLPPLDGTLELVGCANGLVCIRILCFSGKGDQGKFILWNPVTKQYRHVILCPSYPITIMVAVGFGYHQGIQDYKLFALPGIPRAKYKPKVLQLRRGTCREIHGLRHHIYYRYSSPVVLAGVWYQVRRTDSGTKILSFDLKEESFALIDLPPINLDEFSGFEIALGLRDKKLCVFAMSKYYTCRGWMMMKEATWTEMFTINVCSTIGTPVAGDDFKIHSTWRGTTIVLENLQSIYAVGIIPGTTLHDSLTLRFEEILETERNTFLYGAFDFVEGLVSPILLEA